MRMISETILLSKIQKKREQKNLRPREKRKDNSIGWAQALGSLAFLVLRLKLQKLTQRWTWLSRMVSNSMHNKFRWLKILPCLLTQDLKTTIPNYLMSNPNLEMKVIIMKCSEMHIDDKLNEVLNNIIILFTIKKKFNK